ncbi:MAG TPA: hypothetical protein PKW52_04295 [Nitrospira sp.]|nr:hypothetical protein [Nitrospira sp.]HQV10533.1 hypothetical protein [Nitrospira sp.]
MATRLIMLNFASMMLLLLAVGCSLDASSRGPFGPADPETPIPKRPLPAQVPTKHALEFTADESPGHIKPKMAGSTADAVVTRSPNPTASLSASEIADLRRTAEADPRVRALLGARWGFIDADPMSSPSKMTLGCCRQQARFTRLTYFSYSHNVAVEVNLKDGTVLQASRTEGYLPPEGPQDVQRGIELARADARLSGKVNGLQGHGLLMQPDRGFFKNDPGYGHRVMWITFSQGVGGDPKYWAQVDLTDDRVLDAGDEPPR